MINIDTPMPIQWSSRWAINKQLVHRSCDFFARIAYINIPYLPPPRQGSSGGHSMDLRKMGFIFFLKTYCSHILYQQKNMFSNFCSSFVSKQWIGFEKDEIYLFFSETLLFTHTIPAEKYVLGFQTFVVHLCPSSGLDICCQAMVFASCKYVKSIS